MATNGASENVGKLIEIKGVVVDAVFPNRLPEVYSALRIGRPDGTELMAEVQQHLGDDRVRAVAMDSTDGLARGSDVIDTAAPISAALGPAPVVDDRLDEYPTDAVVEHHSRVAVSLDGTGAGGEPITSHEFQQVLDDALSDWVGSGAATGVPQSWPKFVGSRRAAVGDLAASLGSGEVGVAVTSGGAIGASAIVSEDRAAYNAFGEIASKSFDGRPTEYFDYDNAGHLWRTNQKDGVDKVYLYDVQGHASAEIRSLSLDLRAYADAASADNATRAAGADSRRSWTSGSAGSHSDPSRFTNWARFMSAMPSRQSARPRSR